jgi:hypothetical protein
MYPRLRAVGRALALGELGHVLFAGGAALLLLGCSGSDSGASEAGISATGDAFSFELPGTPYGRIADGALHVLEQPDVHAVTAADGHFQIKGLAPGEDATFVLVASGFPEAQTRTFPALEAALERVTFQVPNDALLEALAGVLQITPDPTRCQMVTTITRVGKSIYDAGAHGEAGATVAVEPPLPAENGPVYFNSNVIPDRTLTESSDDGGVVFVNVPPGEYTLTASKLGVNFETVRMQCRANVLVNASPPYGLQALP